MGLVSARVVTSVAALTIVLAMACRDVDSFTGGGGSGDGGALPSSDASPPCNADTQVSIDNCGTCENRCSVRANGVPECAAGVCRTKCNPGFGDCDGNP